MRITILASGSRGDVQPLVALGAGWQRAGHQVTVAATRDFAPLVTAHGLACHPFSVATDDLLASDLGRTWLGHSSHRPRLELRLLTEMVSTYGVALAPEIAALAGTADLFVSGVLSVDGAASLVEAGGGRHLVALLAPFHPTRAGWAGVQAPVPLAESWRNRASGQVMNWFLAGAFRATGDAVRRELGLAPGPRRSWARRLVETPALVGVSPTVLPRPSDWPEHVAVTGSWFLPDEAGRGLSEHPRLAEFLAAGEPPVYVGFGSMSSHDSRSTTSTVLAALARSGRRAVVHRGAAGLADDVEVPSEVLVVDDVPHGLLFPQCGGVIHHGGAGTTAAALRAGVPSAAVAHMGDQPYWGRRIHELGAGPAPIRRHELTVASLTGLLDGLSAPGIAERAAEVGARVRAEDGVATAVTAADRLLG
ncbi:glycosyltransferase [Nocardioides sp.]|uniref:glycosyltransferase n=1 Tax=Nocardioides sp. TaxID=35761 RepID=UPI003527F13C